MSPPQDRSKPSHDHARHCDVIHAVEAEHSGRNDITVLYIPTVSFTFAKYVSSFPSKIHPSHRRRSSASYPHVQLLHFTNSLPAPDFLGGACESGIVGRYT